MNTSKRSMITVTLFPNEYLKHIGIVCHSWYLSGQYTSGESLASIIRIQEGKITEAVLTEIVKR